MIVIEVVAALTGGLAVDPETLALSVVKLVLVCVVFILLCWMFIGLYRQLEVVINLLADVIHYFATDDHGKVKPPQRNIQSALWKLIERCNRDSPSSRIVLVAHSLGTVIVTDLLTMQRSENPDRPDLAIDLVTAGSPLRRLIHRMMPHRMDAPPVVRRTLRAVRGVRVKRWFNCFRAHDIVGKALSDPPSGLPWRERRFGWGDSAEAISERPLQPGRGLPNGHSNYWSDSRFLEVIGREVIEPLLPARSAMAQHAPPDSPPATPGSDQRN